MAVFFFLLFFPLGIKRHLKDSSLLEEVKRSERDQVATDATSHMFNTNCERTRLKNSRWEGGFLSSLKCRIYNRTTIKL